MEIVRTVRLETNLTKPSSLQQQPPGGPNRCVFQELASGWTMVRRGHFQRLFRGLKFGFQPRRERLRRCQRFMRVMLVRMTHLFSLTTMLLCRRLVGQGPTLSICDFHLIGRLFTILALGIFCFALQRRGGLSPAV